LIFLINPNFLPASLFVRSVIPGVLLAVLGFSLLWSMRELHEQEKRVRKGWFPANPKRNQ
jgi:hypothetical protein